METGEVGNAGSNGEQAQVPSMETSPCSSSHSQEELMGKAVHSEEEAHELYREHGRRVGFSVRKGKQSYYAGTNKIRTKDYYCSKEGFKIEDCAGAANFNKPDTRTGCKAMIRFAVDEQGKWKVTKFVNEHNHEFVDPGERHLLRSVRAVTSAKASLLYSMVSAGVRTIDAYSYMVARGGGAENLGFTKKDCYNFVSRAQKQMLIDAGDAQSLVCCFRRKAVEDGMFYWDVQLDQEGRMTNFFWRDGKSRADYDCFGDVVFFDTTYRMNGYNLICAPFVGVNNHWQNVMFGCAFLLDETTASFKWLFKTFLDSMGDQPPKTIVTDRDEAVGEAIEEVFPHTRHHICSWHISRNTAPLHLGSLNYDRGFHQLFDKCLQGCESEEEFEETWAKMISEYVVGEHEWLNNLYKIRWKWCTALNRDVFDAGITSSERREGTCNVLNGIADRTASLTKFVLAFEKLVKGWRRNEAEEDYHCHQSAPTCAIKHSNFLKHAARVYTHKIYKLFESEYLDGCGASNFQETACGGTLYRFDLVMQGRGSRVRVVHLDTSTMEVKCSCKKFETVGILCSHSLASLHLKNAPGIPDQYILRRWTKDARTRVYTYSEGELSTSNPKEAEVIFRNRAMQYAYNLVTRSQEKEEARKLLWSVFDDGNNALGELFQNANVNSMVNDKESNDDDNGKLDNENEAPMLCPPLIRPKRVSNARPKGHLEKRKKSSSPGDSSESRGKSKKLATRKRIQEAAPSMTPPLRPLIPKPAGPPTSLDISNHRGHSNSYQVYPNNLYMSQGPQIMQPMHDFKPQIAAQAYMKGGGMLPMKREPPQKSEESTGQKE